MKVFFTASQRGKKEFGKSYSKIAEVIHKNGLNLIDDDILSTSTKKFYQDLDEGGDDLSNQLYKEKMKHLHEADIAIFDCSVHSLSIGYILEKSLELNKPTIALYIKGKEPYFLEGAADEKLITKSYTLSTLEKVLSECLENAKERRDKRFNFFISPRLLEYLESTSKKMGITKSTFIRNLLLEHKGRNSS